MGRISSVMTMLALASACEKQPEPPAKPISVAAQEQAQAPHGAAPEMVPAGGQAAAPNELLVAGKIAAGEDLAVPENATLFVMGRVMTPNGGGPLVLVKRIPAAKLPLEFSLTGSDVMMQGAPAPEQFALSARLDQDGDAISRTPGDLVGEAGLVKRGAKGVELVLSEAITEGRPSAPVQ